MIKEVSYQIDAVNELANKTIKLLSESGSRKKLVFKAPTGSGKTIMASLAIDELKTRFDEEGQKVAFIWIAPNKLHQQSYLRMKSYFSETCSLHPIVYDEMDHSNNGFIKEGEIFFVNWESINKENNVIVRDTENSSSLYDIVQRTQEEQGMSIIVVIDEEHFFAGRNAKQSENVLQKINPKVEIRISATPVTSPDELVSVSRESVIKEEMIKDGITINPLVNTAANGLGENEYMLDLAVAKRNELKAAYETLGIHINPLLLIQLPNDRTETVDEEERSIIEMVKARLDNKYDITSSNGRLAVWLSNEKQNLEGLENNCNFTEALLFKQAIALGWDCPRAAVLLIFRDIKSTTFGVQTVGRIMRMPEQKYYPVQMLNHGWVYTNLSKDRIEIVAEDMNYLCRGLVACRRESLNNVSLPSLYCERLSADRNRLGPDFWPVLVETINDMWLKKPAPANYSPFEESDGSEPKSGTDGNDCLTDTANNRSQAEKVTKIDFGDHNVQTILMKNVEVTGEVGTTLLTDENKIRYAKSYKDLLVMFNDFCTKLLPGFEKISISSLRGYLYQLMDEYFGCDEMVTPRIILYHKNRSHFEEVIRYAVAKYVKIMQARQKAAGQRSLKEYIWEVPERREYNENTNVEVPEVKDHALLPFIQLRISSLPEKRFEAFLEANKEYIDWWYKNGDEGKGHYSIAYIAKDMTKSLFYVDFIIKMKDGTLFLFDTKSQGSDIDAPRKHNALIDYTSEERGKGEKIYGGVLIENGENWNYSTAKISDTCDISEWKVFHPDIYGQQLNEAKGSPA